MVSPQDDSEATFRSQWQQPVSTPPPQRRLEATTGEHVMLI
ncbi:hypothetical protein SAZ_33080 [Streptomyces noursei ZPM]|nr:hypothetical protein SAZ_33080 [Streptomyces noursei ZPM]EPY93301.1 hypothetical protein K530_48710 [Streptomyces noursei CCRC 11814]